MILLSCKTYSPEENLLSEHGDCTMLKQTDKLHVLPAYIYFYCRKLRLNCRFCHCLGFK